jgi:hypothetical protein
VIPSSQIGPLFARADPRNWAQPGSDVFRRSQPGVWARDGWHGGVPWRSADRGQIYEIALAQINDSIAFEIHNILDISGFQNDLAARPGGEIGGARRLTLKYEYALQQNLGSKLGFIWETEGIDIDNGSYRADATRLGDGDEWRVSITVEKRLRYTAPRTIPAEMGAALNVMAPAFLSMFMHELVYGVLRDLDGGAAAAPQVSAPPSGQRQKRRDGRREQHDKKGRGGDGHD